MASSVLLLCFLNLIFISIYYTVECTSPDSFPFDLEDLHPLVPLYMLKENRTERVLKGSSTSIKTNTKFIVNNKPPQDNYASASTVSEISKTDMYLLNAIEKLAFRMEAMEKRLKTSEELIFQIMEGSNIKRQDACPANFTRVARNCYFFGDRMYNWKSAASMCKSMGSTLIEIESRDEFMEVVTYLQATNRLRGLEYWTGGLNPGLLWIWSSSARPVISDNSANNRPDQTVHGTGRCLRLAINRSKLYEYQGVDCGIRQRFICEHEENATIRALRRIQKALVVKEND